MSKSVKILLIAMIAIISVETYMLVTSNGLPKPSIVKTIQSSNDERDEVIDDLINR